MIRHDVVQGTTEWAMLRVGIPTASEFDKIITPKTLKPSTSAAEYAHRLIAEQLLGMPLDNASSGFMERGTILETKAISYYETMRDCDVDRVGFVTTDDGLVGCSPDGFVGDDGGVEIKTPSAHVHIGYLLGEGRDKYRCQVQGTLWITGRAWWDWVSYNPDLPSIIVPFVRDEAYMQAFVPAMQKFQEYMHDARHKLHRDFGLFDELAEQQRGAA